MADENWKRFASPKAFYPLAGKLIPWFLVPTIALMVVGLYMSFFTTPADYRQGEAYRIIYIHVPAAWMSMWLYLCMAFYAGLGLVVKTRLSSMMAAAIAPTGAMFTFIALWTGAFWGRPMWGAYWVWDARLTSELILLFLYVGVMALRSAIDEPHRADRASGLLALIGAVNVPIIYYSVKWWNTLHQGASVSMSKGSEMAASMLLAMLVMTFAFWAYSFVTTLMRVRSIILERERHADWVTDVVDSGR